MTRQHAHVTIETGNLRFAHPLVHDQAFGRRNFESETSPVRPLLQACYVLAFMAFERSSTSSIVPCI